MKHQFSKKLFFLLLTCVMTGNLFAQTTTQGMDFWVSIGSNYSKLASEVEIEIKVAANTAASVTLTFSEMENNNQNKTVTFPVSGGSVYTYTLTEDEKTAVYQPNASFKGTSSKSLHITSTTPVSVYVLCQWPTCTDATNLLPVDNWGEAYYHISYSASTSNDNYIAIASQDETKIYEDGSFITKINTGEVYTAASANGVNFTGKCITSDKPIAYFVSTPIVNVPITSTAGDHLFQQLPPIAQYGTRFLVPSTKQQKGRVRIMASQNGTNITQQGATKGPITQDGTYVTGSKASLSNLQAGEFVELEFGSTGCFISSNKPVGVCAYMVGQSYVDDTAINTIKKGDPSEAWVAPIEQSIRNILVAPFIPDKNTNLKEHYALIVTPTSAKNQTTVSVGGAPSVTITDDWTDNPTGYSFCSYEMDPELKNVTYLFDNPKGLTVLCYGIGERETYYYMSGSASRELDISYFINDIFYDAFTGKFCDEHFEFSFTHSNLSTASNHALWRVDGTLIGHTDELAWDTVLPYGTHIVMLEVVAQNDQSEQYPLSFTVVPSSVTWTPEKNTGGSDAAKQNWNDTLNWTPRVLPAPCTDVHIPGDKSHYPVLTNQILPECNNIYFEHGSEILRTDLLSYSKAHVDLKVRSNRWYMFSPPLLDMYSGDFYKTDPDPAKDKQTAYTMLFNAENPETKETLNGEWTGAFNVPNVLLKPGSGLALWIDDGKDYGYYDDITFNFPKNDVNHYMYNPDRYPGGNISGTYPTDRPQNGRFAYEAGSNGSITLKDVNGKTDGDILVGNPFMAHLDFKKLQEDNSGALGDTYKLASGVATANGFIKDFYSYIWSNSEYVSTNLNPDNDNRSGFIPPMQAFVISVNNGQTVTAKIVEHTKISTASSDTFRTASQETTASSSLLNIIATRGEDASKALILQNETSTTSYTPSEDSYKLFISKIMDSDEVLKHIQVYTRSSDGYALDINSIGKSEQDITIPLCIRTSEKGEITLNFSGMESFGESTGIYLYDTQYPKRLIDLKTQPEYAFEKTENDLYLENRLSLIISKNTLTGPLELEAVSKSSAVRILNQPHRTLRIISENGEALGAVRITDSWGRTLLDVPAVSSSVYEYQTPMPGIYIVHVGTEVKKVVSIQ